MTIIRGPLHPYWAQDNEALIRPMLQKIIDQDPAYGFTMDACLRSIQSQTQQLWMVDSAALFLTSIHRQQSGRLVLNIFATGGENVVKNLPKILAVLESYARMNGCYAVEAYGRRGWERLMSDYRHKVTCMFKELP